jgi:hypothetical protein
MSSAEKASNVFLRFMALYSFVMMKCTFQLYQIITERRKRIAERLLVEDL